MLYTDIVRYKGGFTYVENIHDAVNRYFSRIQDKESDAIEDGARLLAQAVISGHSIYLYGANELQGVFYEATESKEPFPSVKAFPENAEEVTESDRVLMFCSGTGTAEEQELAKELL